MSKCGVARTLKSKVRYWTLFWPKYPIWASAGAGAIAISSVRVEARAAVRFITPPAEPPGWLQRTYLLRPGNYPRLSFVNDNSQPSPPTGGIRAPFHQPPRPVRTRPLSGLARGAAARRRPGAAAQHQGY